MENQSNAAPAGYHTLQPYLMFQSSVDAIAFYKKAFGATERLCMKADNGQVVHAEIQLGDSCLMLADENAGIDAFSAPHYGGSPVSLMIYVQDCDAVYHEAIACGAVSEREPADQRHGDRIAGVKDPFGYKWWITTNLKELSRGELEQLKWPDR
jgi:PhnB protein